MLRASLGAWRCAPSRVHANNRGRKKAVAPGLIAFHSQCPLHTARTYMSSRIPACCIHATSAAEHRRNIDIHIHAGIERALANTGGWGGPPFCTPSWKLGAARMCSSREVGRGRGSRRIAGERKEYNPEERDAKQVTLASFQDSAGWDTYICQSSREGNASPTFTGASPELYLNPLR